MKIEFKHDFGNIDEVMENTKIEAEKGDVYSVDEVKDSIKKFTMYLNLLDTGLCIATFSIMYGELDKLSEVTESFIKTLGIDGFMQLAKEVNESVTHALEDQAKQEAKEEV